MSGSDACPEKGPDLCIHWVAGACFFGARCKFAHPLLLPDGRCVLEGVGPPLRRQPRHRPQAASPDLRDPPPSHSHSCADYVRLTSELSTLQRLCDDVQAQLQATKETCADLEARLARERSNAVLWTQRFADCLNQLEALSQENAALKASLGRPPPSGPRSPPRANLRSDLCSKSNPTDHGGLQ
eukprot:EG_transcript_28925